MRLHGWLFIELVVIVIVLYLAREVLIPVAMAVLFSFLLAPAVHRLERWHVGRGLSAVAVTALFVAILAGIAWFAGNQAVSLVGKLPQYRENIAEKLQKLRAPPKGNLGKAAKAVKEIEKEIKPGTTEAPKPPEKPQSVVPASALQLIGNLGVSLLALVGSAIAVIVLTALMLVEHDDLRERVLRLVSENRVKDARDALRDAGKRVSRYLLMQLLVNACYGLPLAAALWLIGLPNALLFGLLATILRFVPYLGAAVAAALPILLAFAISDGWDVVVWTAATIGVLEFVTAYIIEPRVYGESTGLTPLAIVLAAIFWTWLWGPLGLLLATPLTVCLAVMGKHVPPFGLFYILFGSAAKL